MTQVTELRAIPNNARLMQLGTLANVVFGIGRAAAKDRETFRAMREGSPRFSRALKLVLTANELGDLSATRAYVDTVDPGMWLARARKSDGKLRDLRETAENLRLHDRLARVLREFEADALLLGECLGPAPETPRRRRVILLHALRAALIQRVCALAMRVPDFSPQHGTSLSQIRERLMRLDIPATVKLLTEIFPQRGDGMAAEDFGEAASWRPDEALSYGVEHENLFRPLLELHGLILTISSALSHECGACG
jgi:phosphoenolpyruvate carboxylase